ncbi:hypothetical protein CE91St44_24860 [Oscillospiraceae bacterium]|nr:hypothetical protein CE91St44_24860 [Oscillospiraceae bacterium]
MEKSPAPAGRQAASSAQGSPAKKQKSAHLQKRSAGRTARRGKRLPHAALQAGPDHGLLPMGKQGRKKFHILYLNDFHVLYPHPLRAAPAAPVPGFRLVFSPVFQAGCPAFVQAAPTP